jgi:chemotaxis protein CheD
MPGFEHIQRLWDRDFELWSAKILPGEYYVTRYDEAITTVLGSCISACMRDPALAIGGMNHFMLPADTSNGESCWLDPDAGLSTRYGSFAMESLINDLMKLGARRERLEVKLFGGGKILASMTDVGARNIAFAKEWLQLEGLNVVAEDLGDTCPRRVIYFPANGAVKLKRLRSLQNSEIGNREQRYLQNITEAPAADDIELFD